MLGSKEGRKELSSLSPLLRRSRLLSTVVDGDKLLASILESHERQVGMQEMRRMKRRRLRLEVYNQTKQKSAQSEVIGRGGKG